MFVVLNVIDGTPKKCWTIDTWDEAVDKVLVVASEMAGPLLMAEAREEVEDTAELQLPHLHLYILATEN
jgi:hypothetical protein